jgi:NADPH:quinone reductase-like Zn-dependent oxidoreductase
LKAIRIHCYGGIDQLRCEDTGEPQLRTASDVIVKLKAAAVNRIDLALRTGKMCGAHPLPRVIGSDGAGIVLSVGPAVRNIKPGDAVCLYPVNACGDCRLCARTRKSLCEKRRLLGEREDGTYGEYVRVPAQNCFPVPSGLSFEEAAAFPLVYLTAWRMLITDSALKPGETVLVVGAGGGIATAALHIATGFGARVFVTSAHEEKLSAAAKLGGEHAICTKKGEFAKAVRALTGKRGVDVVVNCVGGPTWTESLAALARGGRLVTCGAVAGARPNTDLRRVFWNHLTICAANAGTRREFLRVLDFLATSKRKPVIDTVFPLEDASWAHQRMEEGNHFGKIILRIGD